MALLLSVGCASTKPTPDAKLVDDIKLQGVKNVDEGEIKKRILTSETGFFPAWVPGIGHDDYYDATAWQSDLKRIERYYQSQGYYQAKVTEDVVRPIPGERVVLEVKVEEGPVVKLSELSIQGLENLPADQREEILKKLPLKVGDVFIEEHWAKLKELIPARLNELGYVEAVLNGEVVVRIDNASAQAKVTVTPGARYRMGDVFIDLGESRVSRETVLLQAKSAFSQGDWYSESTLTEIQGRVFQMGVFSAVRVTRAAPDRQTLTVPIAVKVSDAPFHTIRAGVGLGIDQVRQEANGSIELTHRNFFGGLRRGTVKGKAGYAFLPDVYNVAIGSPGAQHGPVFSLHGELEQPPLNWKNVPEALRNQLNQLSFQASLDGFSGLEPTYSYIGVAGKVGLMWKPLLALRIFPSYNIELYPKLSSEIPLDGRAPEQAVGCTAPCPLSYLEETIEYDRRDKPLEPREGYYASISFQQGGGVLGGQFSFYRIQPEVRGYVSFGEEKRVTLGAKLKAGTLLTAPDANTPIVARFFSGGASSMRGFNTRRLSPMTAVAKNSASDGLVAPAGAREGETLPVGGKGLIEASVELRWNFYGDFVVAFFFDTGLVSAGSLPLDEGVNFFNQLQHAVGLGLRYRTPVGPIRVDVAMRLPTGPGLQVTQNNPQRPVVYPTDNSCFGAFKGQGPNYGGSPEGRCVFQLSVGEAF
ncbi:MAG: BamA/TamA family outer membrane protein [Myxococcaceae bacterium]|nr:BamA/TamA family outer membrane protein [Myxococcaceae bacterium]